MQTQVGNGIFAFAPSRWATLGLLAWALAIPAARADVRSPTEGTPRDEGTNLYDLPTSKANQVLLPLIDKWVSLSLRSGQVLNGRLVDIRVTHVVLRGSDGKEQRILRRDIAQARLASAPASPTKTIERLQALKGRLVRLHKNDGTHLDGVVRSLTDTEVSLETSQGMVGVPVMDISRAAAMQPPSQKVSTNSELAPLIGRVLRIYLIDNAQVQGVLREVSEKEIRVETDSETVTVPLDRIKRLMVGTLPRGGSAGEDAPHGAEPETRPIPTPGTRTAAQGLYPHRYQGRDLPDQALRKALLEKYIRIKVNGARLRNWGLALMLTGVVLEIVGTAAVLSSSSRQAQGFGYSAIAVSSTVFLVGLVMAPWGQVRHFRGMDMENTIYLTR